MGGRPSKGTSPDKRLKENKPAPRGGMPRQPVRQTPKQGARRRG